MAWPSAQVGSPGYEGEPDVAPDRAAGASMLRTTPGDGVGDPGGLLALDDLKHHREGVEGSGLCGTLWPGHLADDLAVGGGDLDTQGTILNGYVDPTSTSPPPMRSSWISKVNRPVTFL